MGKIIKVNMKNLEELAQIDFESEHQGNIKNNISKSYMKKGIVKRMEEGHEIFFGFKEKNILKGYVTLKPFFPGHKHCEVYWLSVRKKY